MAGRPFIGFHASHEQFTPSRLKTLSVQAEQAGFSGAMCSDHFLPWSERQGESGFAWSWLGSALEATNYSFGVVNAPGERYHPAIIAQAAATLCEMYPGRFWIAVGSGENINEHITGTPWPEKAYRNLRLEESVAVMRRLWNGETVSFSGTIRVSEAKLYTRPPQLPLVVGAALTPETARRLAGWADALITVSAPPGTLREILAAWHEGGGENKPAFLQVKLSWAETRNEAEGNAWKQWGTNTLPANVSSSLKMPEQFDAVAALLSREAIEEKVIIETDPVRYREILGTFLSLGFSRLYLHNVGPNQEDFVETFGRNVLPALM